MLLLKPHQIHDLRTELEEPLLEQMPLLLSLLSDPTRFRVVKALALHPMLCVTDLAALLHKRIATISHHLKLLKHAGMVRSKRLGQTQCYTLTSTRGAQLLKKLVLRTF